MMPPVIWNILLLIPVAFVFVVPWVAALFSSQERFPRKLVWALLSLLFSWIGYFAYYYVSIKKRLDREGAPRETDS